MPLSMEEVQHVAKLARLELSQQELQEFQRELNDLLGHFQDIAMLDVAGLTPKPHAVAISNAWMEDDVLPSLSRNAIMQNAPRSRAGLFVVPTIIEE
jgi:aspartyl-tRNA(Asn)/glutamyl-tRNA(Gln) amidotransferase subunit C